MSNNTRYPHIAALVELRDAVLAQPHITDTLIQQAIIDALTPNLQELFNWLAIHDDFVSIRQVSEHCDWTRQYTSASLGYLYGFGLVERHQRHEQRKPQYVYRLKLERKSDL